MPKIPAVFFDRDGTLIYDRGYMSRPEQIELLPGAIDLLSLVSSYGYFTVIVSNQSGIGRGFMTAQEGAAVHARFDNLLSNAGVPVGASLYCPHAPHDNCRCRKPQPGLLLQSAAEHDLDLSSSFMVGDKESDCQAGAAAGCISILLAPPGQRFIRTGDNLTVHNLGELKALFEKILTPQFVLG